MSDSSFYDRRGLSSSVGIKIMEDMIKKWWPKALEITIFILLMLFTMKSELGSNGDLIERNYRDLVKIEGRHESFLQVATEVRGELISINNRLEVLENAKLSRSSRVSNRYPINDMAGMNSRVKTGRKTDVFRGFTVNTDGNPTE